MFKFSAEYIQAILQGIFDGTITVRDLPESLYNDIAETLKNGIYKGFGIDYSALTKHINEGVSKKFDESDLELLEELRTNIYQFSAAKVYSQVKEMSEKLTDEKGTIRPFKDFKEDAEQVFEEYNENYLETEYNTAIASAQAAVKWNEIEKNKEALPYLEYSTIGDACDICAPLDGITAPVDDPIWDVVYAPNHFNCLCIVEQLEADADVTPDDEKDSIMDDVTDKMSDEFKMNSGKDGYVFKEDHPYYSVPKEDVKFAQNNFDLPIPKHD